MSINEGFLIEIDRETTNTRRLLERIEDKHFSYKPHEKSMSLGALANHIVELHNWVKAGLSVDEFDLAVHYKPLKATSKDELLSILNDGLAINKSFIESMTDLEWQKLWKMTYGDHIIAEVPKIGALRFIIQNHLIHHRGQLTVYMRLLDIPLPGLYGPSADEQNG